MSVTRYSEYWILQYYAYNMDKWLDRGPGGDPFRYDTLLDAEEAVSNLASQGYDPLRIVKVSVAETRTVLA